MGRLVLVLLGILVSGVFVAGIFVLVDDDSGEPASPGAQTVGGPAGSMRLWSTRENVAICIDVAGEASLRAGASELRVLSTEAVNEAMEDVVTHSVWLATESLSEAAIDVIVDPDCPGEAKMQCPENSKLLALGCESSLVSEPSPYRLFVFVVSEADLQRVTGGLAERLTTLEHVCAGDSCDVVTTATWVSEMEVADRGALYELLAEALGLSKPRD